MGIVCLYFAVITVTLEIWGAKSCENKGDLSFKTHTCTRQCHMWAHVCMCIMCVRMCVGIITIPHLPKEKHFTVDRE